MTEKLYGTVLLKSKDILNYIYRADHAPTLKEISSNVNISKPTVLKILRTLEYCGFVKSAGESKKYYLGTIFIRYGDKVTKEFNIVKVAMPYLKKLRDETTEAVNLGIIENNKVILLGRANSTNSIRFHLELGGSMNMYCSGMGKALLADYSSEDLQHYLDQTALTPLTKNTITTKSDFLKDLNKTKQRGYAIDNIENQDGVYCIGFSLVKNNHIFGGFSISAPVYRVNKEKIKMWIKKGKETQKKILDLF